MADPARIEQFRKMANDDPNNELAHFSLGRALLDSGDTSSAIDSFQQALSLNANISKVYQLLAEAHLKLNDRGSAVAALTRGVQVADARGDVLPKNQMIASLTELGAPIPAISATTGPSAAVGDGQVHCKRCGQVGKKLARPPFKTEFGQAIFEGTCAPCWQEGIKMGTKVINELRLPLSDPQAQKVWDQHIREFLNL